MNIRWLPRRGSQSRITRDPRRPANRVLRRRHLRPEVVISGPRTRRWVPRFHLWQVPLLYLVAILIGTVLLVSPAADAAGHWTSFVNALFTATSAVCVTGLTRVETAGAWSGFGEAVILGLIQLGGLGIMLAAGTLLTLAGRRLAVAEWLGISGLRGIHHSPGGAVAGLVVAVLLVELVAALLLMPWFWTRESAPDALWKSVFHAVSAFNNAGFDLQGSESFTQARESAYLLTVLALTSFAGSLSFWVMAGLLVRPWTLDLKLVLSGSVGLVLLGMVAFVAGEATGGRALSGLGPIDTLANAFFLSTMGRTTGFSTVDFGAVRDVTAVAVFLLMFVGGVAGSTAGGIKVGTLMTLLVAARSRLRAEPQTQAFGRRIAPAAVDRALVVTIAFAALLGVGVWSLELSDDAGFLPTVFEALSALGTVGWSTGITPSLSVGGALIVALLMYVGRLTPVLLAAAASDRPTQRYRLVEEGVRIG